MKFMEFMGFSPRTIIDQIYIELNIIRYVVIAICIILLLVGIRNSITGSKIEDFWKFYKSKNNKETQQTKIYKKDIKLSILKGKQDEIYQLIIEKIFNYALESFIEENRVLIIPDSKSLQYSNYAVLQQRMNIASEFCKELGKELPYELSSPEKFLQFYNGMKC